MLVKGAYKKSLMSLILASLVLAGVPLSQSHGIELTEASADRAFILAVSTRIDHTLNANRAKILNILTCLKKEGTTSSEDCNEYVTTVKDNIRINYPKSRTYLALKDFFNWRNFRGLINTFEKTVRQTNCEIHADQYAADATVGGEWIKYANPRVRDCYKPQYFAPWTLAHPLDADFGGMGDFFGLHGVPHAKYSAAEWSRAFRGEKVSDGIKARFDRVCKELSALGGSYADLCEIMDLQLDHAKGFYFERPNIESIDFEGVLELIRIWKTLDSSAGLAYSEDIQDVQKILATAKISSQLAPLRFKEASEEFNQEYFDKIKMNPYVALVQSAYPPADDLIAVFQFMHARSIEAVNEHKKLNEKIIDGRTSRRKELSVMQYSPVVADVLMEPARSMEPYMINYDFAQEIAPRLQKEHSKKELWHGLGVGAFVLGVNIACWLPSARGGRLVAPVFRLFRIGKYARLRKLARFKNFAKDVFKPYCMSLSNLAINFGFLYVSMEEYATVYREIFLAVDDESYLRELEDLSYAEMMVLWDLIMLPTETSVLRLSMSRRLGHKLTELTQTKLINKIRKARQTNKAAKSIPEADLLHEVQEAAIP